MFAMVLAIGLLVDDAIVVVENVERVMSEEGLSPREATRKSMDQITGALVGIALVLSAVFVPMAFFGGSTGVIYRQFSITIVSAMALSVLVAIVLTPALCATMLKPGRKAATARRRLLRLVQPRFDAANRRYQGIVGRLLARSGRFLLVVVCLAAWRRLAVPAPAHLLPAGRGPGRRCSPWCSCRGRHPGAHPEGAGAGRPALHAGARGGGIWNRCSTVQGFSFAGSGQNNGMAFVKLKDWEERAPGRTPASMPWPAARWARSPRSAMRMVFAVAPPPVTRARHHQRLQRGAAGPRRHRPREAGGGAQPVPRRWPRRDKLLSGVRKNGQEDTPQFQPRHRHREGGALGLPIADINDTLSTAWGGQLRRTTSSTAAA
jgi:multidrug efflux pump subunit AcrB